MPNTLKKSNRLFFSGVLILTFSNILIKVIGLTLKIPLSHILGDDGMAYYNVAYDIYVWFYMISTAGLPIAVSILISESRAKGNFREAKRIFRITLTLFVIIGLFGMGVMMGGSKLFAAAYKFGDSYIAILAIAPTLFFICISSAIRGYFQGYQNMFPTAISQIIEAVGKLTIGILFALYGIRQGYSLPVVAALTVLGLTIGVAAAMLFLCVSKLLFREVSYNEEYRHSESDSLPVRSVKRLLWLLVITSVPIMLSASVMSFTNMIDGMIISRQLQSIGYAEALTRNIFGNYKTLAVSMFNLPPALIYPISYSVIPLISAAIASGDKKRVTFIMNSTLKTAALIAIPCSIGMSILSEPILKLLFPEESAVRAAPLLSVLSLSVFFVGMLAITNALLQAHKLERKPIVSMIAGSAVKLILSYILIGIPQIGIYGAPIGTFFCYFVITMINFYFLSKYVKLIPSIRLIFIRPLFASLVCSGAAIGSYRLFEMFLPLRAAILGAITFAALVYIIAVFVFRCISKEDILLLPKGQRIYGLLQRVRLMR
ncbi:MAG: putative polysaccharide biosynthesis protein [Eubacteriales bacterium]